MYKTSHYNLFIPYQNRILYYNTLFGANFMLSRNEHKKIQEHFLDPIRFELESPSVFKQFMEWGFIIEESVCELDIIRFRHNENVFRNRDYHLMLLLTGAYAIRPELIQALKNHVALMIEKEHVTSLLIDWCVTSGYEQPFFEIIGTINDFARQLCERHSIAFNSQADLTSKQLSIHEVQSLNETGATCYSLSLCIIYDSNRIGT